MQIIFVYNANSGKLNAVLDIAHKIVSPSTYACALCQLTHDTFQEKNAWRIFRDAVDADMFFLHKDEFEARYTQRFTYPIVLQARSKSELEPLLTATELQQLDTTQALIERLEQLL